MQRELLAKHQYGGTMRLGAYSACVTPGTLVDTLYKKHKRYNHKKGNGKRIVLERHRHRYEVNPVYIDQLAKQGLIFSGYHERKDGTKLMEFAELPQHNFFIGTQSHPEFKSRFGNPSPFFYGFVHACYMYAQSGIVKHNNALRPRSKAILSL